MNLTGFFDVFELIMCSYTYIFIFYYFFKRKRIKYKKVNNDRILVVLSSFELKDFVVENIKKLKEKFKHIVVLTVRDNGVKIDGVDIIKTPEDFKCNAIRKGRDLLYFAKSYEVPKDIEYVLFLDEDSYPETPIEVPEDADVIVFSEYIEKHKNPLITISELQRRGFAVEEWLFLNFLNLPFYLWGGGLLVKKEFINDLPDYPSIIEDSVYGWNIYKKGKKKVKFARSKTKMHSCPPSDIKSIYKQRARWFMGTVYDVDQAPTEIKILTKIRLFYWVTSLPFYMFTDPIMRLIAMFSFTIQAAIACKELDYPWYYTFTWLIGAILNTTMAWTAPFLQHGKKFDITRKACEKQSKDCKISYLEPETIKS